MQTSISEKKLCAHCGAEFTSEQTGGRPRITCSDECRIGRTYAQKRERKLARGWTPKVKKTAAEKRAYYAEWMRRWRRANPERASQIKKKWMEANLEKSREQARRSMAKWYRGLDPEERRQHLRRARDQRRARKAGAYSDGTWPAEPPQPECQICGTTERLERDHIVPISKGGDHTLAHCQTLCRTCNASKGAQIENAPPA